jgi:hypothetical protein
MPVRTLLSPEQRTRLFSVPTDVATMTRHYVRTERRLSARQR